MKYRIFIFLACLLISFAMWYLASYSQKKSMYLSFPIQVTHFPNGYILTGQSDKEIGFQAQASLHDLEKLQKKGRIPFDLSEMRPVKIKGKYQVVFFVEPFFQKFLRLIDYDGHIDFMAPDSIIFFFETSAKKEVPIKLDIQYDIANQYKQYTPAIIMPEMVIIEGRTEDLDTIKEIKTKTLHLGSIRDTFNQMVALEKPRLLRLLQDSVHVMLPITEFTEKQIEVIINANMSDSSFFIKLLPDHVTVSCLVPVENFNNLDAKMFTIEAQYNPGMTKYEKKLPVRVIVAPENVHVSRISPEYVDYIIIEK